MPDQVWLLLKHWLDSMVACYGCLHKELDACKYCAHYQLLTPHLYLHATHLYWLHHHNHLQPFLQCCTSLDDVQVDLAREARHLWQFNYNFRHSRHVTFPYPVYPLVSDEVLVETFEARPACP